MQQAPGEVDSGPTEGKAVEVIVLFAHANGFNRETWRAVIQEFNGLCPTTTMPRGSILTVHALDLPGHGLTGQPLDVGASVASASAAPSNWDFVGESIRRSAEQLREDTRCEPLLIGVGHSLGGAGCLLAELQSPAGLFDSLLVWEPILFDPSPQAKRQASGPDKAKASSRRRADFDSPQQALESFATKPLFADWDPRSLEGYIDGGLRPKDSSADMDGGGWTLCCAPKVEGWFFSTGISEERWQILNQGKFPACPTRVVVGEKTNISLLSPGYYSDIVFGHNPHVRVEVAPGGHLGPLERPQAFAEMLHEVLADCIANKSKDATGQRDYGDQPKL